MNRIKPPLDHHVHTSYLVGRFEADDDFWCSHEVDTLEQAELILKSYTEDYEIVKKTSTFERAQK